MRWRLAGFTLIELMLLLALMVTLWLAASQHQSRSTQVAQARQWTQAAAASLQSIRQRAVVEQQSWLVCGSDLADVCESVWAGDWWARAEHEAGRVLLHPAIPRHWRVYWRGFRQQPFIAWTADGDATESNGTLTLCPPLEQDAALRQIVISRSGRLRIQVPRSAGASTLASARAVCGW